MKNGEVLKKKRQQGGKVMKDSELRMIETMLKKQDELNLAIMKEYGLTTISKEQIDLSTLDEIGEFTHELKGDWCWWKKTQAPVDKETPKKPIDIEFGPCGDLMLCCPTCKHGVVPIPTYHGNRYYPRCPFCGQLLK